MMRKTTLVIISFFLVLSIDAFAKKPPKWARKVHWEEGGYHYFVGVSTKATTEEEGRREALDNATTEAIQSLFGISGRMDMSSYANLQKIQIAQDVFVSTDQVQLKPKAVDIYVEKVKVGNDFKYTVYRSIKVEKGEAAKELERLKSVASKKASMEGKVVAPGEDVVLVSVEGESVILDDDEPNAKSKAVRIGLERSCERLAKDWFYKETLEKNYTKLKSTLYDRCPSLTDGYEVNSSVREGNIYKARMTVKLKSGEIRRKLMDMGLFRERVK